MLKSYFFAVAIAAAVLLPPAPGFAVFELGKSLKYKCTAEPNSHDRAACLGYLSGVADVMMEGNTVNKFKACIPENTGDHEIWQAVVKLLKENPGNLHYTADDLVAFAYQEAFPCD